MRERKQFTKEFQEGAVRLVTEQGRTIGDAAQSLGYLTVDARRGGLKRRSTRGLKPSADRVSAPPSSRSCTNCVSASDS